MFYDVFSFLAPYVVLFLICLIIWTIAGDLSPAKEEKEASPASIKKKIIVGIILTIIFIAATIFLAATLSPKFYWLTAVLVVLLIISAFQLGRGKK
jgi:uncharacterized Tic20 family protein